MPDTQPGFNPISAGVSAATAGYKIYDSIRKNKAANQIERTTKRPIYNHSSLIDDAYNTALSEVDNTQEKDLGTQQLDNGLYGGIDAILKSGGKADFGTVYNNYGTQMRGLLSTLSKNRDSRIAAANNAAYNLAAAKDAEFQYNQDAPFKDAKQREAQLRGQSAQSLNEGISAIAGGVSNALTEKLKPTTGTTGSVDNTGVNTAPRFANSNPDLIGVDANQFRQQGAGVLPAATAAATGGDMANIDTRTVVGYDTFGDPIYAH
jgi:hypothetical protein